MSVTRMIEGKAFLSFNHFIQMSGVGSLVGNDRFISNPCKFIIHI
jgi:hypothetical protein